MILVNRNPVDFTQFPDGTTSFRLDTKDAVWFRIDWRYDGDHECMLLWYLVHHIRANNRMDVDIELVLPYIPNARMDRVKSGDEVFTMKWFAEFINTLNFRKVEVLDPHSNVAAALIDRICVKEPADNIRLAIERVLANTGDNDVLMCYPDEGAAKRYSDLMGREYVFGIKHRDWRTGKIGGLELANSEKVAGRNVLIVDDICSRGGTFTHTAAALKESGAKEIFLYVSHCENTIFKGSVLTDGQISRVFTTNSIYRGEHEKVTVLE